MAAFFLPILSIFVMTRMYVNMYVLYVRYMYVRCLVIVADCKNYRILLTSMTIHVSQDNKIDAPHRQRPQLACSSC